MKTQMDMAYQKYHEEVNRIGAALMAGGGVKGGDGAGLYGGAIDNFIPTIWSARILVALQKTLVFAQANIVNRDYEGEIREAGDTVNINSIGDPTVFDYTKNTDMPAPETLTSSQKTLVIDQSKAFNFQVDDVDKAQTRPQVMDAALSRVAYKLADVVDQYLAGKLLAGATLNTIGTTAVPIVPTAAAGVNGAYEQLVDLGVKLDEQNVPTEGRWVVVPPWFHGLLTKDSRFVSYAAVDVLYNRQVGEAAGFAILVSNNTPTVADPGGTGINGVRYKILAGHAMAATYAEQINQVEAYRPERRFGDAVKGLHLYGASVERSEAVAVLTAVRG